MTYSEFWKKHFSGGYWAKKGKKMSQKLDFPIFRVFFDSVLFSYNFWKYACFGQKYILFWLKRAKTGPKVGHIEKCSNFFSTKSYFPSISCVMSGDPWYICLFYFVFKLMNVAERARAFFWYNHWEIGYFMTRFTSFRMQRRILSWLMIEQSGSTAYSRVGRGGSNWPRKNQESASWVPRSDGEGLFTFLPDKLWRSFKICLI